MRMRSPAGSSSSLHTACEPANAPRFFRSPSRGAPVSPADYFKLRFRVGPLVESRRWLTDHPRLVTSFWAEPPATAFRSSSDNSGWSDLLGFNGVSDEAGFTVARDLGEPFFAIAIAEKLL
jgi:hypothetical protein